MTMLNNLGINQSVENNTKKQEELFDNQFNSLAEKLYEVKEMLKHYKKLENQYKNQLIELCNDQSFSTRNYSWVKSEQRGSIDYSLLDVLKEIDLEPYRKDNVVRWSLAKIS